MKHNHNSSLHNSPKTVLIAPLDWGLGHATRCIPIIKELISKEFKVIVAASGKPYQLLKAEFPGLNFLTIDNYNISYSKDRARFSVKLLSQFVKISNTIQKERRWISSLLKKQKIDILISDNRPGLVHPSVHCIYITHQVNIETGNNITNLIVNKIHHNFIRKFDQCWIPDSESNGLSGKLSHPVSSKINAQYINPLSRFTLIETPQEFDIAVILSGPEPQRTILEEIILQQAKNSNKKIVLIRGLPNAVKCHPRKSNITCINHLSAQQLNKIICSSSLIICRSGYTSIMDLVKLRKKAVLIPTPGQKEQEYLARYLAKENYFPYQQQQAFDLQTAWDLAQQFPFNYPQIDFNKYKQYIAELSEINT